MEPSVIEELRLTSFKSFQDQRIALSGLTLLIGRNGAGKSNLLDGLEVLSRLASGDDLRDALEGGRGGAGPVRGGVEGSAPRGRASFQLGCTVRTGEGHVDLDVEVQVAPTVQVLFEELRGPTYGGTKVLLRTQDPDADRADIDATWWNGKRGRNPSLTFRASRLLTSQVTTRVPSATKAARAVHRAASQVIAALSAVFHLDPVPHLMRQYVPERDILLRRTAENLSAVVRHLYQVDAEARGELRKLLTSLPEHELSELIVEGSALGDVMLAVREVQDGKDVTIPARLMSDGMLRFLAIATALLSSSQAADRSAASGEATGGRTLVIEELENGLHPTQAERVLELLVREGRKRAVRTLATTHSPALLSALAGEDHDTVVVCDRDPASGYSRVRPLPELPGYHAALATGSLGEAVTRDLFRAARERDADTTLREFEQVLGIG